MAWVRSGECNRCGDCCKGQFETGIEDPTVNGGYCTLFRWAAPSIGACMDRQSAYYRKGCCDWPTKPEHLVAHPRCSYRFAWAP
jgi:hypothetical protein